MEEGNSLVETHTRQEFRFWYQWPDHSEDCAIDAWFQDKGVCDVTVGLLV